jgi:hypothetical protein
MESIIVDIEQQVTPVLIVSHLSVLQMLIAYMSNSPVEKAMSIEVPMHTVLKFTPSRGGGWTETRHQLIRDETAPSVPLGSPESEGSTRSIEAPVTTPIWEDPASKKRFSFNKDVKS